MNEILEVRSIFSSTCTEDGARLGAMCGWFDVHFWGSEQNPAIQEVELTTAPSEDRGTHWGQQVFLLHASFNISEGDEVNVSLAMLRSKENHQLMEVDLNCEFKLRSMLHDYLSTIFDWENAFGYLNLPGLRSINATARVTNDEFHVDFMPAAKAYQSMDRLVSSEDLPMHSSVDVEDLKKDKNMGNNSSSRYSTIHLIPLILFTCGLILWLFSYPSKV